MISVVLQESADVFIKALNICGSGRGGAGPTRPDTGPNHDGKY